MEYSVFVTGHGHQKCDDMHSWGPGVRQNYIIHFIMKGTGYLEMDGKKFCIKAGESFLTYPGKIIHYYPDSEQPWEYMWVDFVGEGIPALLEKTSFRKKNPVCPSSKEGTPEEYFQKLCKLDIYYKNKLEANGVLLALLGFYGDTFPFTGAEAMDKKDDRLSNALLLIQTNYHKSDFHISALCEMLGINRVTLYRLFTASVFCSPNTYLLHYRLEQAKKLLALNFSVKQTAISCGYSDPFYFSRAFKNYTGLAPSDYVKDH